jgi:predicted transcriptional regulator
MQIGMKLKPKDVETLARQIEGRRLELGYTYSDISLKSGVNQGQVSRICRGKFKTKSGNVMQICTTLGIAESTDLTRLREAVLNLWDGSSTDADRISRLLELIGEVRRSSLP